MSLPPAGWWRPASPWPPRRAWTILQQGGNCRRRSHRHRRHAERRGTHLHRHRRRLLCPLLRRHDQTGDSAQRLRSRAGRRIDRRIDCSWLCENADLYGPHGLHPRRRRRLERPAGAPRPHDLGRRRSNLPSGPPKTATRSRELIAHGWRTQVQKLLRAPTGSPATWTMARHSPAATNCSSTVARPGRRAHAHPHPGRNAARHRRRGQSVSSTKASLPTNSAPMCSAMAAGSRLPTWPPTPPPGTNPSPRTTGACASTSARPTARGWPPSLRCNLAAGFDLAALPQPTASTSWSSACAWPSPTRNSGSAIRTSVPIPLAGLVSPAYPNQRRARIDTQHAARNVPYGTPGWLGHGLPERGGWGRQRVQLHQQPLHGHRLRVGGAGHGREPAEPGQSLRAGSRPSQCAGPATSAPTRPSSLP